MADDAAVLLVDSRQEARHIHQVHQGDVEDVAETDEAGPLVAGVDVKDSSQVHGLVGHHSDGHAAEAGEADDQVGGEIPMHLQEVVVVH